jgi:hypothetical protein
VEYLLSGNPVVAYMLDGMPPVYRDFMTIVADDRTESLRDANEIARTTPACADARAYLAEKCEATRIVDAILTMNGMV